MPETKIEEWKRKIAHKRRRQEEKEAKTTWDALTQDYNKKRYFTARWTVESLNDSASDIESELASAFKDEIDQEIIKSFSVPKHMMGHKHGSSGR